MLQATASRTARRIMRIARNSCARRIETAGSASCSRLRTSARIFMRFRPFAIEVGRVRELVSAPAPGEIRLQWWVDAIEGETRGDVAAHPVADALIDTIQRFRLPRVALTELIEARRFDLYDDPMPDRDALEKYCGYVHSVPIRLASLVLSDGVEPGGGRLRRLCRCRDRLDGAAARICASCRTRAALRAGRYARSARAHARLLRSHGRPLRQSPATLAELRRARTPATRASAREARHCRAARRVLHSCRWHPCICISMRWIVRTRLTHRSRMSRNGGGNGRSGGWRVASDQRIGFSSASASPISSGRPSAPMRNRPNFATSSGLPFPSSKKKASDPTNQRRDFVRSLTTTSPSFTASPGASIRSRVETDCASSDAVARTSRFRAEAGGGSFVVSKATAM